MSKSGDSFAESGLMRSRGATSSTSDLEPVDLTRSNHSAITGQLKQFEFELTWKTREEIICNLNQHTKLLSGLNFNTDIREKMRKVNAELMTFLMNLPPKIDGRSKSSESLESGADENLTELVLDLSSKVKSRIVDTLVTNHSISLLDSNSIASEFKSKLIDRNNELIGELYRLRARVISGDSSLANEDALSDPAKMNELQTSSDNVLDENKLGEPDKSSPNVDEAASLKKELEKLKVQDSLISNLKEELAESKDELAKLKLQAEGMDVKNEVTISLEFKGIEAVLAGGPDEQSKYFACGGFLWYVKISHSLIDEVEYLEAFLYCKSESIANGWSVVASFQILLLSWKSGFLEELTGLPLFGSHMIYTTKTLPFKSAKNNWRFVKFISVKELRSGPFIRDDTIKLQMKMSIKSVEKIAN